MPHERFTIGTLAKAAGVTRKTVRFYESIGLIPPAPRSASGYRLYTQADLERLEFIKQAQALGLALHDIRSLDAARASGSCEMMRPKLLRLLTAHITQIELRVAELRALKRELQNRYRRIERKPFSNHAERCRCLTDESQVIHLTVEGMERSREPVNASIHPRAPASEGRRHIPRPRPRDR